MLPMLVDIISDSNENKGTGGRQTYIFNTDNYLRPGTHWITLIIEVINSSDEENSPLA